tara:strand:- start:326 stop:712 length:387 start_codon:yes stop_codon:yes gene_type:complete
VLEMHRNLVGLYHLNNRNHWPFDFHMIAQLEINFAPTKHSRAFEEFDEENPIVWELFQRFTGEAIDAGLEHFGSQAILERIRWETTVTTSGVFKINNNFGPFYARKYHRHHPSNDGFFITRKSKADNE